MISAPRDVQAAGVRIHIAAARLTGLPLVIHSREAEADTIADPRGAKWSRGSSRPCSIASRPAACWPSGACTIGAYVSFSGMLTYKGADEIRAVARLVPLDRLLVETDAPYLAPVPYRGKPNEPAFVVQDA